MRYCMMNNNFFTVAMGNKSKWMPNQSCGKYCRHRVPLRIVTVPDDTGCSALATNVHS